MTKMKSQETKQQESMQEYESLRNEIISFEEQQRNVWIHMYLLFSTLFVLGLQWSHYLFLVNYIILIPFQCVINDYLWSVSKISTYIRVFFEATNNGMNWESLHVYDKYYDYYNKKNHSIAGLIRISGATHLGFITTGFFCGYTLIQSYHPSRFELSAIDVILILLSVFLLCILVKVNIDYNKRHHYELEKLIKKYQESINNIPKNVQ